MAAGDDQGLEAPPEAPAESSEQQRAVALARERAAALNRVQDRMLAKGASRGYLRQLGLTARAVGPEVAGAVIGGAAATPAGLTIPGALAGGAAMTITHIADQLFGTNYVDKVMDALGVPKPANPTEEFAQAGAKALASGAGAIAGGRLLAENASGAAQKVGELLARDPGTALAANLSGSQAQEYARQKGAGPTGQFLANVAGSFLPAAAAPAAAAAGAGLRKIGEKITEVAPNAVRALTTIPRSIGDVTSAVGAAFGHQGSINKISRDVIDTLLQNSDKGEILAAGKNATTYVPGASPTVGEALAEANLKNPTKQIGGEVIKLQQELTGGKGVENILPSKLKANQAAIGDHIEAVKTRGDFERNAALLGPRAQHLLKNAVPVQKIQSNILNESLSPGFRMNKPMRAAAEDVMRQIKSQTTQYNTMNPDDLYAIRMNVGNTIRRHMEKSGGRWDAKLAGGFERNIQNHIDDAIEASGGVGWRSYLKNYSEGMEAVRQHQGRLEAMGDIAKGVKGQGASGGELVREQLPMFPTLLHRPVMFANYVLHLISKDAATPVMRNVAKRLQDPEQFAQLVKRPPGTPANNEVNAVLLHAAILSNLIRQHQATMQQNQQPAQEQP